MTLSGLDPQRFEDFVDGKATHLYVLRNQHGAEMAVCNYGGVIVTLMMPDSKGMMTNVVLGMEDLDGLVHAPEPTFGAAIGRYGNRIAGARFMLDGTEYHVGMSQAPNALHGGFKGFHKVVWDARQYDASTLVLRYISADGEEGFPGTLSVVMTYCLTDNNELRIDYSAVTDKPTICNLTNHSYFNLDGVSQGTVGEIGNHSMQIHASRYVPIDEVCIPLGYKAEVKDTPFDFRLPHTIGERIDADDVQIRRGAGYDHCFCIDNSAPAYDGCRPVAGLREAVRVMSNRSGIAMTMYTTEPGVQLYTANWLNGFKGYNGCNFPRRCAFCLEAQHHPDSINQPAFEQPILLPGMVYAQTTIYAFSTTK